MKKKELSALTEREQLTGDIFSVRLRVSFSGEVCPGQFVSLFSADGRKLLPRPISVCDAEPAKGEIRLIFRAVGEGTREFSRLRAGDRIAVMGPLGNGFPLDETAGRRVLLIGGGVGIPPLAFAAKALAGRTGKAAPERVAAAVGFRTKETYLLRELEASCRVYISTDDGSLGTPGTVLDAVRASEETPELIFACGPKVMLRAVKTYAAAAGAKCYVSMEERMACGVGVCLGCVCRTTGVDEHSLVSSARVCADGPVFPAEEVEL